MKTEKLYYTDAYMKNFTARVISCNKNENSFEIILDKTAFFPNEGGQPADTGFIGSARISDVREKDGVIIHIADSPVAENTDLPCEIDFDKRFIYMQTHSGEHIISGLIHRYFGLDNVGFHINTDAPGCTIDVSGELTKAQLRLIEQEANSVICKNIHIKPIYPKIDELSSYEYRSKLELTENVRLIEIAGIDLCACCAPHVSQTGEIGLIKLQAAVSHRGGTRLTVLCGKQAFADYSVKCDNNLSIASLLSAKHNETAQAVEKLFNDYTKLKKEFNLLKTEALSSQAEQARESNGNILFITDCARAEALRECFNSFLKRCDGLCGAFSGNDINGYAYIMGSNHINLSVLAKDINAALCGKGGGKPGMIQGSVKASAKEIEVFFENH